MDQVKPVTHDNQRELVGQLSLLEKVLDTLWIVATALTTYPLNLLHLACLTGSL